MAYTAAGLELVGTIAFPDPADGPFPGLLIAHEAGGLDSYQRGRALEFAREGFVAFALDYHGAHAPFASVDAKVARRNDLLGDADQVRALTGAALDVLSSHHAVDVSRLAAIGYCLGGALVLELARTGADLKAVAGVHPSLHAITPADTPRIKGEVLVHVGGATIPSPRPSRARRSKPKCPMRGVHWQMHVYGGVRHSFTNATLDGREIPGLAYDRFAAEHTRQSVLALLKRTLSA